MKRTTTTRALEDQMILVASEVETLEAHEEPTRSQEARLTKLREELRGLKRELIHARLNDGSAVLDTDTPEYAQAQRARADARRSDDDPSLTERLNGRQDSARDHERARRVIDAAHRSGSLADHSAQAAEQLVTVGTPHERAVAAERVEVTGNPDYYEAFVKLANDPVRGHLLWTEAEREAFTAGGRVQALLAGKPMQLGERAMSLTDSAGGYLVPFQLDPSIILTDAGHASAIVQVSRTVTATGDVWNGVSSAGVSNSWDAEGTEVSDDSPTLATPSIPIHMNRTFVPISIEALMDGQNVATEVARLIADEAANAEATAVAVGSGSGQPTGIITALAGGASAVAPTAAESITASDPYKVQNALDPRYQGRATWHANLSIINTLAQFETTSGALKFPEVGQGRLLRRPLHENSAMDGTINAAATETNYTLVYGDFQNFVVARRIGLTVELVPHLFGENGRPTGQRGWFAFFRMGSDSVNDAAFKLLSIPTTA